MTAETCAKRGCPQGAQVRGMCRGHYNAARKYSINRQRWCRYDSVGTERRLRALIAIGYTQSALAGMLNIHPSYITKLCSNTRRQVNADTAQAVAALYDRLSMTPGPSQRARSHAHRRGWQPPLAWDDDQIDNPAAGPVPVDTVKITWRDRYIELQDLGYTDLEIADKLGIKLGSLLRQMTRYDLPPSPELVAAFTAAKTARRTAS